jgi:hypothetical protein
LKDEEDVFESDFQSTEEEEIDIDADKGEKLVQDEERHVRKVSLFFRFSFVFRLIPSKTALSRVQRATALAHARQQATFHPDIGTSSPKQKNRVSKNVTTSPWTGDHSSGKRQSKRMHTILNTSATVNRLKHAQEKRVSIGLIYCALKAPIFFFRLSLPRRRKLNHVSLLKPNSSPGLSITRKATSSPIEIIFF